MTGPVVAVLDPSLPFSVAAVHACADRDEAAAVVIAMQRAWPNGIVTVLYDDRESRAQHPAGKARP